MGDSWQSHDNVISIQGASPDVPLQPSSYSIWAERYQLRDAHGEPVDASMEAMFDRVARALAAVEAPDQRAPIEREFRWALDNGAIPAGRILANAGAEAHKPQTTLINCTVSRTIRDSLQAILDANTVAGLTLKAGAGIGYDFSTLRPKGALVAGAGAPTNGPVAFMQIFDQTCRTIGAAGGRRGAQMATLDIGHPDIERFILAKRRKGRLTQFNLSVLVRDAFLEAVERDDEWALAFPLLPVEQDGVPASDLVYRDWPVVEDGYRVDDQGRVACRVCRRVRARELWDTLMRSTYDVGEPGVILIDQVNRQNNAWFDEVIRATNPCITADTWIHTSIGPRQVRDLLGQQFRVRVDGRDYTTGEQGFVPTGAKQVVRLATAEGYQLKLTADHRLRRVTRYTRYVTETEWCAAARLREGDRVLLNDHRAHAEWPGEYTHEQGYLLGMLVGDGTLKNDKAVLSVWKLAAVVGTSPDAVSPAGVEGIMEEVMRSARTLPHRSDFSGWQEVAGRNEFRLSLAALKSLAEEVGMGPGAKSVTPAMEQASSEFCRGFLRGMFDADGSVQGGQQKGVSVRLSQSDMSRLEAVQRMLLRLGIASSIYRNRRSAGMRHLPDGNGGAKEYAIKAQHELIVRGENLQRFLQQVGFADTDKKRRLEQALARYKRGLNRERFVARVTKIEPGGIEEVFDVSVPDVHAFDANGLCAHNCGEQPLPPDGACLLGSVNLTRFVSAPFSADTAFDWERFERVVRVFTRMLDNVADISGLPLPEQRAEMLRKRRHGMGILGLGSALAMLGETYGSESAAGFTAEVCRRLALASWRAGLELAREKGPAPIMDEGFTLTADMLRRQPALAEAGYQVGDVLKGRELHARFSPYMQHVAVQDPALVAALAEEGARFTHATSIAPTGTISFSVANNASNGIEPTFLHHTTRNIRRPGRRTREAVDCYSYELLAYRALVDPEAGPEDLPANAITAERVGVDAHIRMQAAAQPWVDSAISKTLNVPSDIPFEGFKEVYLQAWRAGLKGCTTYRPNPQAQMGVLVDPERLRSTWYTFTLADGRELTLRGDEEVEYEGQIHTAANLFAALDEGYYDDV
ncbi:LAGLIDADG family homing endonuclease [Thioalkalivibrio sp. HL-Eb18]|uniref:LAGLIDADG family homing endonuclease n=1 Tax=Thioalkalivibrio sp. HL-Eb18 TaxID=1266913 RepID=UPI000379E175|nr:LAGLIDADG family homing endonuclease [Thioalkalivibrio sp. HL-Eb18]